MAGVPVAFSGRATLSGDDDDDDSEAVIASRLSTVSPSLCSVARRRAGALLRAPVFIL